MSANPRTGGRTIRALVTDGDERPALAIVRSLGRRGVSVLVSDERPVSLASSSRYCAGHVTCPSPYRDPHGFQQFLATVAERQGIDVVVPVTDVTTHAVAAAQSDLGRTCAVAVPPLEAFELVSDKWTLIQRARQCEIPVPLTHLVDGPAALTHVLDEVRYPAVVKPARSRIPGERGWLIADRVRYADVRSDLRRLYDEHESLRTLPSLIQERIVGPGVGVFVLFDRGRPLAAFAHRRLREKPPSGGVSVLRESVRLDPRLVDYAVRMLGPLGWHGVVMVEFKHDRKTGSYVLMEVNGRYWGSLQLAIDAGIDFPYLSYQLALGRTVDAPPAYRVGVKSRWLLGDLDHLLARLVHSDRSLRLPDNAPSRLRALLDFMKFVGPGLRYEVLSGDDPRPFLYELRQYATACAAAALQRMPRADAPADQPPAAAPVRVCHVMSADLWAGAEVQVATIASYLARRPDVSVSAVLLNEGRLAEELRRMGVPVAVVDERRTGALRILMSLVRILRNRKIDVVHTHRYKDNVLGSIAAKLAGVPHVVRTVHGLNDQEMRGWQLRKVRAYEALDKAALWCAGDRIIAVSERLARVLRQSGYKPTAVRSIRNGVDLRAVKAARSSEEVRRELGIAPGAFLVGTVGRLSLVKGHADLVKAAGLLVEQRQNVKVLIVGGGPLEDELRALVEQLGLQRNCFFVGPRSDVYDLIGAMDVFALPSLDEGIPMALLEAMALGTPVVASKVGGIPEVIRHGNTGLLVPPQNPRALAEACLRLACDPDHARALATRAAHAVRAGFSHETNGEAVLDLYREVMRPALPTERFPGLRRAGRAVVAFLAHARHGIRRAAERRRTNRIRRRPHALASALRSAKNILVVCQGNIIRSPFAARLIAQSLGDARGVSVSSAGLEAVPGDAPHAMAVPSATARGVDLRGHAATPVTRERVASSDVILVMDVQQALVLRSRFPEARRKTFLLTSMTTEAPLEIRDPFDGDESVFQTCYDDISRAARPIVSVLSARQGA